MFDDEQKIPYPPQVGNPLFPELSPLPCALSKEGWVYIPHADGNWVSAAKLGPFSMKIIEHWRMNLSREPRAPGAVNPGWMVEKTAGELSAARLTIFPPLPETTPTEVPKDTAVTSNTFIVLASEVDELSTLLEDEDLGEDKLQQAAEDLLPRLHDSLRNAMAEADQKLPLSGWKYKLGDHLRKKKGGRWTGKVVGFYSTELTPEGYAIESNTEVGSVQIYPESALEPVQE